MAQLKTNLKIGHEPPGSLFDQNNLRQKALISNLWVILSTIFVSAIATLPTLKVGWIELFSAFSLYSIANAIALLAAYRGYQRLSLYGYTAFVFVGNTMGMLFLNEQSAHMVLAMVNFVLLHAVTLGKRSALVVTGIMLLLLLFPEYLTPEQALSLRVWAGVDELQVSVTQATRFPSLLTTTFSTGYLIATSISLEQKAGRAVREAFSALALTKLDLQARHERARILSETGASLIIANQPHELTIIAEKALNDALNQKRSIANELDSRHTHALVLGTGPHKQSFYTDVPLESDEHLFVDTLSALIEGAQSRMNLDARRLAAERLESVGRLAASVAHDFNNLLMPIQGVCELLHHHQTLDENTKELVAPAVAATRQAKAVVKKLLVHASSASTHVEQVNFADILQVNEGLLRAFVKNEVELRFALEVNSAYVLADRVELEQVVLNLVLNAIDAVGVTGKVLVRLAVNESSVCLEVLDDGPGVDEALVPWVFEPFNSTRDEGSGLGLSTVKRIVESGGGTVTLTRASEGGTIVQVNLPRILEPKPIQIPHKPTELPQTSRLIMLVEDDPNASVILREMLHALGHTVIVFNDGLKAARVLRQSEQVELVMTDFQMPGLNGGQLIDRMRKHGDRRPVVMLTGYGVVANDYVKDSLTTVLGKPVTLEELRSALSEVLQAA